MSIIVKPQNKIIPQNIKMLSCNALLEINPYTYVKAFFYKTILIGNFSAFFLKP